MDLSRFADVHVPALEADEVRFNLPIAAIASAANARPEGFRYWALGPAGHCAIQWPGRPIVLGDLSRAECQNLARLTIEAPYQGVVGTGETAQWFVEHAAALGAAFDDPIPQRIHALAQAPRYPGVAGSARAVTGADAPLLLDWLRGFHREAVPHDPRPEQAGVAKDAGSGRFLFWTVDARPVSVAAVARRLRNTGAISSVYTPPEERGRGYAGAVTAALAERLLAEGKTAVCLYTDLRNPISNRCYARIGFMPHCDALHYVRKA